MGLARLGRAGDQGAKPAARPVPTTSDASAPAERRGLAGLAAKAAGATPSTTASPAPVPSRPQAEPAAGREAPPTDGGYDAILDWAARGNMPGPDDVDLAVRAWLGAKP